MVTKLSSRVTRSDVCFGNSAAAQLVVVGEAIKEINLEMMIWGTRQED